MSRQMHDWAKIIEEQPKSGNSVTEYCRSRGIHPNTFYTKRKLLLSRPLVEIQVAGSIQNHPLVVSAGRYQVSIHRGFDRECLKAVLEVIGDLI